MSRLAHWMDGLMDERFQSLSGNLGLGAKGSIVAMARTWMDRQIDGQDGWMGE